MNLYLRSPNYPISRHEETNFQPAGFWSTLKPQTCFQPEWLCQGLPKVWRSEIANQVTEDQICWHHLFVFDEQAPPTWKQQLDEWDFFFTKLRDPVSSQMCLVSCSILPPWNSISLVCVCQPRGQAWSSWTRETGRWSCWGLEARAIWKQKPWIFELTVVHHFNLMSCLDWFHPLFRKSGWNNTYCIHDTWFVWILRKIPPNLVKSSWFQLVEVGVFVG